MSASPRSRFVRACTALVSLSAFLGAAFADAQGLDPCPHHDALNLARHGAAAHAGHGPDMAGMPAMADMPGMEGHAHGHDHDHGQSPEQESPEHGPCTCVGSCDTGGGAHVLPGAVEAPRVFVAAVPLPAPARHHEIVRANPRRWTPVLPQAPPLPA